MWTGSNNPQEGHFSVFAEYPVVQRVAADGLFYRRLSRKTVVATISRRKNFGSAAPFSMHLVTHMVVRPSHSLKPFCSGVLGELSCLMIAVVFDRIIVLQYSSSEMLWLSCCGKILGVSDLGSQ